MSNNDYHDPMDCQVQPEERIQAWEQSPLQAEMSEAEMEAHRKDWEMRVALDRRKFRDEVEEWLNSNKFDGRFYDL
jgi:hypothetical protein